MSDADMTGLEHSAGAAEWRKRWARWLESGLVQGIVVSVILVNAAIMGMETSRGLMATHGTLLHALDKACLAFFVVELLTRLAVYRAQFWRSGWNWFDFVVVAVALVPGGRAVGGLAFLARTARVAIAHRGAADAARGGGVSPFHSGAGRGGRGDDGSFYTAGVLATVLFGTSHPQWFGTLGGSLYSLFQIMTLESWSMGIVRPVMEVHSWAWAFFVPFIMIATFTILNLFIGIIVSTMQELSAKGDAPTPSFGPESNAALLQRLENDLAELRKRLTP